MLHRHLDYFQTPPLGGRPTTKPGDHGIPNAHNRWFILFYHVWGPTWIDIGWNSIWWRARSPMTSQYTWGFVTTLHDFGSVFGWPLDTFSWALTILWSQVLALVWSDPKGRFTLWPRKLDQGIVRALIGCWSCPMTTSVYTKEKIVEGP